MKLKDTCPWKKSYDKCRQCTKKQRHIVKPMVFPLVMYELDHKEGWAPKNWCFQTVVLQKTLESPLKSREISSVQFSAQSFPTLCDLMNRSTPGLPVHHQLPEFTQTHVHWVGDAIQPSHPLSSPSPPAPNPSQHQGLFQWVNSSHEVAKVLEFWPQHQCFQWIPRTRLLWDGLVGSSCSPRDSPESSPAPQFKSINSLALSCLHHPTLTSIYDHWKNHSLD